MDRIFDYAVLQAVPDVRRGEKVNVGIAVMKKDGIDVRVFETRKIQALTGQSWDSHIDAFSNLLKKLDDPSLPSSERLRRFKTVEGQLVFSNTGWFQSGSDDAYEITLSDIARSVILRPKVKRQKDDTSIVAEISSELRSAQILATKNDVIGSGKVVRNYHIDAGLEADFAQLNSKLHVASVLDLRSAHPQLAQAALKAITLDRAAAVHQGPVHKIGVYAVASARRSEVKENIALLGRYADDVVNWEDQSDRRGLKRMFFDAYNSHQDASK